MRSLQRQPRLERLESRDLLTTVQISDEIVVDSGRATVPLEIDNAAAVRAAEIRIEYDSTQLDVEPKDITAGDAWGGKAMTMSNVDEQAGVIVVFVFSTQGLAAGPGNLLDLAFTISRDAPAGPSAIDLTEVRLNEGQIELSALPLPGHDATDGSIVIVRDTIQKYPGPVRYEALQTCLGPLQVISQPTISRLSTPRALRHSILSMPADKPDRLVPGAGFIGPLPDPIFASTIQWLHDREG